MLSANLLHFSVITTFIENVKFGLGRSEPLDVPKWRLNFQNLSIFLIGFSALLYIRKTPSAEKFWQQAIQFLSRRKALTLVILISAAIAFTSSLVVNFSKYSFSDGWFYSVARLLDRDTLLYRDVGFWVTPLTGIIAYYMTLLGNYIIWEKVFGFLVLLVIWTGLWKINFFLTKNSVISLVFTAISIAIGQTFVATVYYEYNVLTVLFVILIAVAEIQRLKVREVSFAKEYFWLSVVGFTSGIAILNKYTDGFANFLFLSLYYCLYFLPGFQKKGWKKIAREVTAIPLGLVISFLTMWAISFFIVDYFSMPGYILGLAAAKGGSSILLQSVLNFPYRLLDCIFILLSIFSDSKFIFGDRFLELLFRIFFPFLLLFNFVVCIYLSLARNKTNLLSPDRLAICSLLSFLSIGSFIPTMLSNSGGWDNLKYMYNVLPISLLLFIALRNRSRGFASILKISSVIFSAVAILLANTKIQRPYTWFYSQKKLKVENLVVPTSGYYKYQPIDREYSRVISEICSTITDRKAAVISYPLPIANLACEHPFPLKSNLFWYDVSSQKTVQELLQWIDRDRVEPVYIVYLRAPGLLELHKELFGEKPFHKKLENYLQAQNGNPKRSRYRLIKKIPFNRVEVKIYKSLDNGNRIN
jgi:hypothetical protein